MNATSSTNLSPFSLWPKQLSKPLCRLFNELLFHLLALGAGFLLSLSARKALALLPLSSPLAPSKELLLALLTPYAALQLLLFAPVIEECLFRHAIDPLFLPSTTSKTIPPKIAFSFPPNRPLYLLFPSLLFALLHLHAVKSLPLSSSLTTTLLFSLGPLLALTLLSFLSATLYQRTKKISLSIFCHIGFNLSSWIDAHLLISS